MERTHIPLEAKDLDPEYGDRTVTHEGGVTIHRLQDFTLNGVKKHDIVRQTLLYAELQKLEE